MQNLSGLILKMVWLCFWAAKIVPGRSIRGHRTGNGMRATRNMFGSLDLNSERSFLPMLRLAMSSVCQG